MSLMSKGKKPIAVLSNPASNPAPGARWIVCCGICKPGLFDSPGYHGSLAPQMQGIAKSGDWAAAVTWAKRHADDHESMRCVTCDHLPSGAINTPAEATR